MASKRDVSYMDRQQGGATFLFVMGSVGILVELEDEKGKCWPPASCHNMGLATPAARERLKSA